MYSETIDFERVQVAESESAGLAAAAQAVLWN
jgi:hypothetical protein